MKKKNDLRDGGDIVYNTKWRLLFVITICYNICIWCFYDDIALDSCFFFFGPYYIGYYKSLILWNRIRGIALKAPSHQLYTLSGCRQKEIYGHLNFTIIGLFIHVKPVKRVCFTSKSLKSNKNPFNSLKKKKRNLIGRPVFNQYSFQFAHLFLKSD